MTPLAKHSLHRSEQELERQVSAMLTPAEMAQLTGDLEAIGLTSPTTGETSEDSLFSELHLRAGVGHAPGSGLSQSSDAPSVPCVLAMIPSVFVGMALVYLVIFFVGAVG